jgi:hypothetical protein
VVSKQRTHGNASMLVHGFYRLDDRLRAHDLRLDNTLEKLFRMMAKSMEADRKAFEG